MPLSKGNVSSSISDAASRSAVFNPTELLHLVYGSRTRNVRGQLLPQIITHLGGTLTRLVFWWFFFRFGFPLLLCFCKRGAPRARPAQAPPPCEGLAPPPAGLPGICSPRAGGGAGLALSGVPRPRMRVECRCRRRGSAPVAARPPRGAVRPWGPRAGAACRRQHVRPLPQLGGRRAREGRPQHPLLGPPQVSGGRRRARGGGEGGGALRGLGGGGCGRGPSAELLGAGSLGDAAGSGQEGAALGARLPRRSLLSPGRFAAALPG